MSPQAHVVAAICNLTRSGRSNWKWPNIPGLDSFQGALVHSANWPKGLDLKNKTVAVLGCGSSGVQIVPTIQAGNDAFLIIPRRNANRILTTSFALQRGETPGYIHQVTDVDNSRLCPKQSRPWRVQLYLYGSAATLSCGVTRSNDHIVSDAQKSKFREDSHAYLSYRKEVEHELNSRFKFVLPPLAFCK